MKKQFEMKIREEELAIEMKITMQFEIKKRKEELAIDQMKIKLQIKRRKRALEYERIAEYIAWTEAEFKRRAAKKTI